MNSTLKSNEDFFIIVGEKRSFDQILRLNVTYQEAELYWLSKVSNTIWSSEITSSDQTSLQEKIGKSLRAVIFFDERSLLMSGFLNRFKIDRNIPVIFITHDFWAHPIFVCKYLASLNCTLVVVRHHSARELYKRFLPTLNIEVVRPAVEDGIFRPSDSPRKYDIILSGTHSDDYPMRKRLYSIITQSAEEKGWLVLDVINKERYSSPPTNQLEYAPLLASAKLCVTGSVRGGVNGRVTYQYTDESTVRPTLDSFDDFYGTKYKDIDSISIDLGGIPPRYMEALATKTLLCADLPINDDQAWYRDKMVVLRNDMSNDEIINLLDYWIKSDSERDQICTHAFKCVSTGETTKQKAIKILELIEKHS